MEEKTKELEEKQYTAAAGGGAVTVTVSGKKEVVSVKISPEAVDPDDVEMLEDMIVAAANEAFHQMEEASSAVMAGADRRPWRFRRPFFLTWTITAARSRN